MAYRRNQLGGSTKRTALITGSSWARSKKKVKYRTKKYFSNNLKKQKKGGGKKKWGVV